MFGQKHPQELLSIVDKSSQPTHNTRDALAKDLGWSTGKLASVKREILAAKGREKMAQDKIGNSNASKTTLSTIDKGATTHNTRDALAKDLGWSTGKRF
jgi:ribosomal protein L27